MGKATTKEIFRAPQKKVFEVITDYGKYPEFLSEMRRVSIIDEKEINTSEKRCLVEFEVQIIKGFRYQLALVEKKFHEVLWKFHSGDVFKDNVGSWRLRDLGDNQTEVEYTVEAKFGLFVPSLIEKKLIEVNLPSMMKAFKTRIEDV